MKKVFSLILALVMCLGLCACVSGEENGTEEVKATMEEAKTTVEEIKKLTLDDIKAMPILELVKLETEDVNHFPAAELKIASQTFEEKKINITEEELKEYINEYYMKDQPELSPLAEDVMKVFRILKERSLQEKISEESINVLEGLNNNFETGLYNSYNDNGLKTEIERVSRYVMPDDAGVYINRSKFNANNAIKTFVRSIIETPVFFAE